MARTLWVVGLAALAALVIYGMRRGWLNRVRRQLAVLPEFPAPPADPGTEVLPALSGLYVGTTRAGDWQDRVAVGDVGYRSNVIARLFPTGLLLEREGASALWIPAESMTEARVDHKLANKVVLGVGLVVVTWRLGEHLLDTGWRGPDRDTHAEWADAIRSRFTGSTEPGDQGASERSADEWITDEQERAGVQRSPRQEEK